MEAMVEVSVQSIRVSLINQSRLVVLKERFGPRFLSIWIGAFEADAITVGLQEAAVSRPLTHDLLCQVAQALGASLEAVRIVDLREDTYFAELLFQQGGREQPVDARPSDAIAVAVRRKVPIFVAESVMSAAGQLPAPDYDGPTAQPGRRAGQDGPAAGAAAAGAGAKAGAETEASDKLGLFRNFVDSLDLSDLGKSGRR